jgi:glutamate-5-semialdehyde dehydrogenase
MSSQPNTNAQVIAKAAKAAFEESQLIPSSERINALHEIRKALEDSKTEILQANQEDLKV